MGTYSTLKGFNVQDLASDPSNTLDGEVWYNNPGGAIKCFGLQGDGAWAAGNDCTNARSTGGSLGTSPTSVVLFGGEPTAVGEKTETWNGTSWTEVNAMPQGRSVAVAGGSSTAGLAAGGYWTARMSSGEDWDGTNWTTGASLPAARDVAGWTGASTSDVTATNGLCPPGSTAQNSSIRYNGTAWTVGPTMNRATQYGPDGATGAPGTTALIFGGLWYPSPVVSTTTTEQFNGSSWTTVNSMNTARYYAGGAGTSTAAMEVGGSGYPGPTLTNVEFYNGTSWTEGADLAIARSYDNCSGNGSTACLCVGGGWPNPVTGADKTEEYSISPAIKTFTDS